MKTFGEGPFPVRCVVLNSNTALGFHDVPCYLRFEVVGDDQVAVHLVKGEPSETYKASDLIFASIENGETIRDISAAAFRTQD
jgi:hypothetical protein